MRYVLCVPCQTHTCSTAHVLETTPELCSNPINPAVWREADRVLNGWMQTYADVTIEPGPQLNLILGPNGELNQKVRQDRMALGDIMPHRISTIQLPPVKE